MIYTLLHLFPLNNFYFTFGTYKTENLMNSSDSNLNFSSNDDKTMIWFFAGGETRDNKFNVFTGSFIRLMKQMAESQFEFIKGIYYPTPMLNVAWALNNAQKPIKPGLSNRFSETAFRQMISNGYCPDTQLVIVSSSSGSVVAAQAACYLAEVNRNRLFFKKPFNLALGATMISKESDLYNQLKTYQKEGLIGKIVFDELQDEGDDSSGIGSITRAKAWSNAFGLMFPVFSKKFKSPSFLNTHPVRGHLHRRRSQTVQKAVDFIKVMFIDHNLAGDHYSEKAKAVIGRLETK